jgi:chemotaxis receptor (MCP) glutamine deamidase CheD
VGNRASAKNCGCYPDGHPEEQHLQVKKRRRIYIGEVAASLEPLLLQTLLGSCVSVCLRDPMSGVGGMNHILLPRGNNEDRNTRFGVNAMELLINEMMHYGAHRRRLVAKAFGAGNVLTALQRPTVGDLNAAFVHEFLATERIPLVAQRLGGTHAVQVCFRTDSGKAVVRSVDGSRLPAIFKEEESYRISHPAEDYAAGEVTLF